MVGIAAPLSNLSLLTLPRRSYIAGDVVRIYGGMAFASLSSFLFRRNLHNPDDGVGDDSGFGWGDLFRL